MKKLMILGAVALLASCNSAVDYTMPGMGSVTLSWASGSSAIVWPDTATAPFVFTGVNSATLYMDAGAHTLTIDRCSAVAVVSGSVNPLGAAPIPSELTGVAALNGLVAGMQVYSPAWGSGVTVGSVSAGPAPYTVTLSAPTTATSTTGARVTGYITAQQSTPAFTIVNDQNQTYSVP